MWQDKNVLVTGGASFIGSHLVNALVARGANIRVVDDLSSGRLENISAASFALEFTEADLRNPGVARAAMKDVEVVFHLAADHGGRGYVDLHQAGPASNLFLDGVVFWEAVRAGVKKICYASSGCVYPNYMQTDPTKEIYLRESDVKPPHDADNMYGWAKLMAEMTLQAYHREYGIGTASCRYFTVYGPRGVENHAVMAMIARAFVGQDPFEIWGDGQQIRNWTYVEDIVNGTLLAAEKIDDGTAVNLGTMERIRVIDAAQLAITAALRFKADTLLPNMAAAYSTTFKFLRDMPTGPVNRVADNSLAKQLLGWEPQVMFADGLQRTAEWYFQTHTQEQAKQRLGRALTER